MEPGLVVTRLLKVPSATGLSGEPKEVPVKENSPGGLKTYWGQIHGGRV